MSANQRRGQKCGPCFSLKTAATLVNYTCKSFIVLTPDIFVLGYHWTQ